MLCCGALCGSVDNKTYPVEAHGSFFFPGTLCQGQSVISCVFSGSSAMEM